MARETINWPDLTAYNIQLKAIVSVDENDDEKGQTFIASPFKAIEIPLESQKRLIKLGFKKGVSGNFITNDVQVRNEDLSKEFPEIRVMQVHRDDVVSNRRLTNHEEKISLFARQNNGRRILSQPIRNHHTAIIGVKFVGDPDLIQEVITRASGVKPFNITDQSVSYSKLHMNFVKGMASDLVSEPALYAVDVPLKKEERDRKGYAADILISGRIHDIANEIRSVIPGYTPDYDSTARGFVFDGIYAQRLKSALQPYLDGRMDHPPTRFPATTPKDWIKPKDFTVDLGKPVSSAKAKENPYSPVKQISIQDFQESEMPYPEAIARACHESLRAWANLHGVNWDETTVEWDGTPAKGNNVGKNDETRDVIWVYASISDTQLSAVMDGNKEIYPAATVRYPFVTIKNAKNIEESYSYTDGFNTIMDAYTRFKTSGKGLAKPSKSKLEEYERQARERAERKAREQEKERQNKRDNIMREHDNFFTLEAADGSENYHRKKKMTALLNVSDVRKGVDEKRGAYAVYPLYGFGDYDHEVGFQRIYALAFGKDKQNKEFVWGTPFKDDDGNAIGLHGKANWSVLDENPQSTIYVTEGFADGDAAIEVKPDSAIAVALTSGNLSSLIGKLCSEYPFAEIVTVADNDSSKPYNGNIGVLKSRMAAIEHDVKVAVPPLSRQEIREGDTDIKDLQLSRGNDLVLQTLDGAINFPDKWEAIKDTIPYIANGPAMKTHLESLAELATRVADVEHPLEKLIVEAVRHFGFVNVNRENIRAKSTVIDIDRAFSITETSHAKEFSKLADENPLGYSNPVTVEQYKKDGNVSILVTNHHRNSTMAAAINERIRNAIPDEPGIYNQAMQGFLFQPRYEGRLRGNLYDLIGDDPVQLRAVTRRRHSKIAITGQMDLVTSNGFTLRERLDDILIQNDLSELTADEKAEYVVSSDTYYIPISFKDELEDIVEEYCGSLSTDRFNQVTNVVPSERAKSAIAARQFVNDHFNMPISVVRTALSELSEYRRDLDLTQNDLVIGAFLVEASNSLLERIEVSNDMAIPFTPYHINSEGFLATSHGINVSINNDPIRVDKVLKSDNEQMFSTILNDSGEEYYIYSNGSITYSNSNENKNQLNVNWKVYLNEDVLVEAKNNLREALLKRDLFPVSHRQKAINFVTSVTVMIDKSDFSSLLRSAIRDDFVTFDDLSLDSVPSLTEFLGNETEEGNIVEALNTFTKANYNIGFDKYFTQLEKNTRQKRFKEWRKGAQSILQNHIEPDMSINAAMSLFVDGSSEGLWLGANPYHNGSPQSTALREDIAAFSNVSSLNTLVIQRQKELRETQPDIEPQEQASNILSTLKSFISNGYSAEDAFRKILGQQFDDLDKETKAGLIEKYEKHSESMVISKTDDDKPQVQLSSVLDSIILNEVSEGLKKLSESNGSLTYEQFNTHPLSRVPVILDLASIQQLAHGTLNLSEDMARIQLGLAGYPIESELSNYSLALTNFYSSLIVLRNSSESELRTQYDIEDLAQHANNLGLLDTSSSKNEIIKQIVGHMDTIHSNGLANSKRLLWSKYLIEANRLSEANEVSKQFGMESTNESEEESLSRLFYALYPDTQIYRSMLESIEKTQKVEEHLNEYGEKYQYYLNLGTSAKRVSASLGEDAAIVGRFLATSDPVDVELQALLGISIYNEKARADYFKQISDHLDASIDQEFQASSITDDQRDRMLEMLEIATQALQDTSKSGRCYEETKTDIAEVKSAYLAVRSGDYDLHDIRGNDSLSQALIDGLKYKILVSEQSSHYLPTDGSNTEILMLDDHHTIDLKTGLDIKISDSALVLTLNDFKRLKPADCIQGLIDINDDRASGRSRHVLNEWLHNHVPKGIERLSNNSIAYMTGYGITIMTPSQNLSFNINDIRRLADTENKESLLVLLDNGQVGLMSECKEQRLAVPIGTIADGIVTVLNKDKHAIPVSDFSDEVRKYLPENSGFVVSNGKDPIMSYQVRDTKIEVPAVDEKSLNLMQDYVENPETKYIPLANVSFGESNKTTFIDAKFVENFNSLIKDPDKYVRSVKEKIQSEGMNDYSDQAKYLAIAVALLNSIEPWRSAMNCCGYTDLRMNANGYIQVLGEYANPFEIDPYVAISKSEVQRELLRESQGHTLSNSMSTMAP